VVALTGVVLSLGLAAAFVTATAAAHRHAQSAADLVALAGAVAHQRGEDACTRAGSVARGNDASLTACTLAGADVVVTVEVPSPELAGHTFTVRGSARAGPAP
jgi:secretion/DNA translocation related TadE-like protein